MFFDFDKSKKIIFFLIIVFLAYVSYISYLSLTKIAYAAGPVVWVEDGMTRVFKTDPAKSSSTITLYTGRNEYETLQIVVKAPTGNNLSNVNVTVSNLTGPNGVMIGADNITLYREYYVYVTQGSKRNNNETNRPLGPGFYPDALIPFKNPATGADLTGSLDAVPFNLAAGVNQPIWVDIYTPTNTPAGLYQGTATVTSAQGTASVNIGLNVWNFSLPKIRSLKGHTNTFGQYRSRTTAIEILKHRLNPKLVDRADERFLIDSFGLDMVHVFTSSGAGYGNCTASPAPSPSQVRAETITHEPELYLYTSYANEVWDCTNLTSVFLSWATNLRQGGSHPIIVTYPSDALMGPDLDHTAADTWVFLPKHYDIAKANIEKLVNHPGTQVWVYNPFVQDGFSPKFTIDFLPINARIMQGFISQNMGFTGSKFWRVDNWTADPWNNAEATRADLPGEGHMVYPGDPVGLPSQIVAGARMKWYREGSEDFEYIQMLKNLGQEQFAISTVRTVATDLRNWSQDKNVLLTARKSLGDKLHSLSGGFTPTPTPTGSASWAKLRFKVQLTDVLPSTTNISAADVQVEVRDGISTVGVANVRLLRSGSYFQTDADVSFNLAQNKTYSILVKTRISLGRVFNNVTLTQSQVVDCTVVTNPSCGELISARDTRSLLSGDSDGFNTSSGSYNKVDSADLQIVAAQLNSQSPTTGQSADYNLDGQVNIMDLEILGKNYGQSEIF